MGKEAGSGGDGSKAEDPRLKAKARDPREAHRRTACTLLLLAVAACHSRPHGARARVGDLEITRAVAWGLPEASAATVGFWLENRGAHPDTLLGASSADGKVSMHDVRPVGSFRRMVEIASVPLPPGSRVVFGAGRQHLMLDQVDSTVWRRDRLSLVLRFAHAGTSPLSIPILRVTEAKEELEGR